MGVSNVIPPWFICLVSRLFCDKVVVIKLSVGLLIGLKPREVRMSEVNTVSFSWYEGGKLKSGRGEVLSNKGLRSFADDVEMNSISKNANAIISNVDSIKEKIEQVAGNKKINNIVFQDGLPVYYSMEDGGFVIGGAYSGAVTKFTDNMSDYDRISILKNDYKDINFSVYDLSKNKNGPLLKDQVIGTEEALKDFLKNGKRESSSLSSSGLGNRLSGLTGIEVMERSQMMDRFDAKE